MRLTIKSCQLKFENVADAESGAMKDCFRQIKTQYYLM